MKKFLILSFLIAFVGCDVGDDDATTATDTEQDSEDTNGENPDRTVNFDLTVLSRPVNAVYSSVVLTEGEIQGPVLNLNEDMNMDTGVVFRSEPPNLIFYRPSFFNRVWVRDVRTGDSSPFNEFFQPEVDPVSISTVASSSHIVTFYRDRFNEDIYRMDSYNMAEGVEAPLYETLEALSTVHIDRNKFMLTYVDQDQRLILEAFDLNSRTKVLETDITSLIGYTFSGDFIYLFGNGVVRIFDYNIGKLGSPQGILENINRGGFFDTELVGNRLYYRFAYAQPNLLIEGPAYYDLDQGANTIFDLFTFVDYLESNGQNLLNPGPIEINSEEEVIVFAYSYIEAGNTEAQWAVAYLDYGLQLIKTTDIPIEPAALVLH
ncbi:hypothetical protein BST85_08995 [Aureitalea marina]|uniref:Uncharacterized protein n=2 Tax=Aureitalea marina TaxID=930804 RepID=A0A2S7KQV8_9FLAO|nr:hypothetical protein BST85_08995 [Aureitalea marina]